MTEQINLKALEKKAWRSFFDDGLWDIYLGLLLGLMGIGSLLSNITHSEDQATLVYVGLMLVVMIAFWLAKRFIVVPRIGRVKFQAKKRRKIGIVLFISVIIGFIVWWLAADMIDSSPEQRATLNNLFPLIYALNALIVFGSIAYFTSFERLYYIGILFALPVPVDYWLYNSYGINLDYIAFIVPAAIIVGIGIWYFLRSQSRFHTFSAIVSSCGLRWRFGFLARPIWAG